MAVFDGAGREAIGTVTEIASHRAVIGGLRDERALDRDVCLSLILALPKGKKMDWIVEKATELGVAAIWPVVSERVVARPSSSQQESKRSRWQRIAVSGAKQSGSPWVPGIHPIATLGDALAAAVPGLDVFYAGVIGEDVEPLRDAVRRVMQSLEGANPLAPKPDGGLAAPKDWRPPHEREAVHVGLLIGPEGDLTEAEIKATLAAGAVGVSFGPRVLRVETAALYGLSVLVYEFTSLGDAADLRRESRSDFS